MYFLFFFALSRSFFFFFLFLFCIIAIKSRSLLFRRKKLQPFGFLVSVEHVQNVL